MIRYITSFALGAIGLLSAITTLQYGPLWPTPPVYAASNPSSGFPLDTPFSVTNRSSTFPIYNLHLTCQIITMTTSHDGHLANVSVAVLAVNELAVLSTRVYTCPFKDAIALSPDETIEDVSIRFVSIYDDPLFVPFSVPLRKVSDVFELNTKTIPPQWMKGPALH